MFSGIVEELGEVRKISKVSRVSLIEVGANIVLQDTKIGDSVAVNGVCLTIIKKSKDSLSFEVMAQTSKISNLGSLNIREKVNLERALKVGDRISGHFVSGHVDYLGVIRNKGYIKSNLAFEITTPQEFNKYIIPRGSISVDGISLTIAQKSTASFFVYIIPHTLKNTTLSFKKHSDKVNIECDILAKKI